jgi:anhydro-N-acetylmuramic acid kinase
MVIDQLVEHFSDGARRFDRDGRIAARGVVDEALLESLLEDPYYAQPPPKSTGRERFGGGFAKSLQGRGIAHESLVATAAQLTARSILLAIERFVRPAMPVDELVVSGGGWRNPTIVQPIRAGLPRTRVRSTDEYGIDSDAKEAIAFAVLAFETIHGRPANLPSATGADRPTILGKIVPSAGSRLL